MNIARIPDDAFKLAVVLGVAGVVYVLMRGPGKVAGDLLAGVGNAVVDLVDSTAETVVTPVKENVYGEPDVRSIDDKTFMQGVASYLLRVGVKNPTPFSSQEWAKAMEIRDDAAWWEYRSNVYARAGDAIKTMRGYVSPAWYENIFNW